MKYFFKILFTPSCWLRNYPTSRPLSNKINKLLDEGHLPKVVDSGPFFGRAYTAQLGDDMTLWIENFPYAYGSVYPYGKTMPDRATVFRLAEAVDFATHP